jgi:hypothetical protein
MIQVSRQRASLFVLNRDESSGHISNAVVVEELKDCQGIGNVQKTSVLSRTTLLFRGLGG